MARFTSVKTRVTVGGLNNVMHKLQNLALWSEKDHKALVEIGEKTGDVYNDYLRSNIKDYHKDILVQFKDRDSIRVKRGQLRRSLGVWAPIKTSINVLAGPRTNNIGKRKTSATADGWFAHIVEGGDSFGRKKRTVNTGVFDRGMKATKARSEKVYYHALRARFARYFDSI